MRAIDAHVHVIVPQILRNRHPGEEWRPRVRRQGSERLVEFDGRVIRSMVNEMVDIEALLAGHERSGIERVILQLPGSAALPRGRA